MLILTLLIAAVFAQDATVDVNAKVQFGLPALTKWTDFANDAKTKLKTDVPELKASVFNLGENFRIGDKKLDIGELVKNKLVAEPPTDPVCDKDTVQWFDGKNFAVGATVNKLQDFAAKLGDAKTIIAEKGIDLTMVQTQIDALKAKFVGGENTMGAVAGAADALRNAAQAFCSAPMPGAGGAAGGFTLPADLLSNLDKFLPMFQGAGMTTVGGTTTTDLNSLWMKLGGSLPSFPKRTRQTGMVAGGFDFSGLLTKLKADVSGTWDRASLCAMLPAAAPKMNKRQTTDPAAMMGATTTFVADFCAKNFPAGLEKLATLCSSVKGAAATGVQQQQVTDLLDKIKGTQLDVTNWQGAVKAKADELKMKVDNCKTKLMADVNGAMVDTEFQNKVQACQAIGLKVKAMAPTFTPGAMVTGLSAELLADIQTCQNDLKALREKLQAKLMANAASCPGLTNVFTCVKRAATVLKFKASSLLACAETLVDGLQNGIAIFKSHVQTFCADAAHKAICDKYQPIFDSAEAALVDVADPDPAADAKDPLCRRAGALKLRFPDPAATNGMAGMTKRDGTNAELSTGLASMCTALEGCQVEDENVAAGTPLKTEKSASGQQVDGVDNVVVPPTVTEKPSKSGRSSASSLALAGVATLVALAAAF